jgi:hypothetical protein
MGLVYDSNEVASLQATLDSQRAKLDAIDKEKQVSDNKALTYAIMGVGAVLLLLLLKGLISKKSK